GSPAGGADFLLFRSDGMNHVPRARGFRGFHVIRDPRDVVVSAYHSHRRSHPATEEWRELNEIRERLNGMSFEAGLLWELENLAPVFRQMQTWDYSSPHIREFRMEELIANPFKMALESFGILGDWERAFTPRVKDRFKELYGPLLIQLGYAASADW